MGAAAYNRGTRAIREQIDRESGADKYRNIVSVGPWVKQPHVCERCHGPLGIRLDRGCAWDKQARKWVDACWSCKRQIELGL